jgi:hypothetical protein
MGFSCRTYLITDDDRPGRLAGAQFDRMLRDPHAHRLPQFAGQRVRMASVIVELAGGAPLRIVRRTFAILGFDREGRLDLERFGRQQAALAESAMASVFASEDRDPSIVDAASRFVAQGGSWVPTARLARTIDEAALGRSHCPRADAHHHERSGRGCTPSRSRGTDHPVQIAHPVSRRTVDSLLDEMRQCKSVEACIDLALTDAYGPPEQASAWLTCIEAMFDRFDRVVVLGEEVTLEGFDLSNESIVAVCRKGKQKARVALESVEFPELSPIEARWLKAWKRFAAGAQ